MPDEAEVHGLLALMLHCEARREARRTPTGAYIPLAKQDVTLWSRKMIEEAEANLKTAAMFGKIGRFQLEAAIQSAHAQRAWTGRTEWEAIALLYEGLVRIAPTIGLLVGRAAAMAEARGEEYGYRLLNTLPHESVKNYQPYWALKAHLLNKLNMNDEASYANQRAMELSDDPGVREFLMGQTR